MMLYNRLYNQYSNILWSDIIKDTVCVEMIGKPKRAEKKCKIRFEKQLSIDKMKNMICSFKIKRSRKKGDKFKWIHLRDWVNFKNKNIYYFKKDAERW